MELCQRVDDCHVCVFDDAVVVAGNVKRDVAEFLQFTAVKACHSDNGHSCFSCIDCGSNNVLGISAGRYQDQNLTRMRDCEFELLRKYFIIGDVIGDCGHERDVISEALHIQRIPVVAAFDEITVEM